MKLTRRTGFVVAVAGLAFSSAAYATLLNYEMNYAPDRPGLLQPMTKIFDGFGDQTAGDFGNPEWAGLQDGTHGAPAGTARFSDTGKNGNDGYVVGGFLGDFSVDMCVLGELNVAGNGSQKSMSFKLANGNGRGLTIEPQIIRLMGSGEINSVAVDLRYFHKIRLSMPNTNTLNIYDLDNDTDPGSGVSWAPLASWAITGGTGAAGEIVKGGIGLNSLAGDSTTRSKFLADWVRIDTTVARGPTDPIIPAPEPAMLVLVLLGGLPLVRRRRGG